MAYTATQKAAAIAIANRHSGKLSTQALTEIRQIRGLKKVAKNTVILWLEETVIKPSPSEQNSTEIDHKKKSKNEPLTLEVLAVAEAALDDRLLALFNRAYSQLFEALITQDVKAKDLATIMAIAFDKMRLAQGLPTHILSTVQEIDELARQKGADSGKILQFVRDDLKAV